MRLLGFVALLAVLHFASTLAVRAQPSDPAPTFERFLRLHQQRKWAEAAQVLDGMSIDTLTREQLLKGQKAAAGAKDSVTLLRFLSRYELHVRGDQQDLGPAQFEEVLDRLARAHLRLGVVPVSPFVRAQVALLRGDTTSYLEELGGAPRGSTWKIDEHGRARYRDLYFPTLRRAVAQGDKAAATRLAAVAPIWEWSYEGHEALRQALVWSGHPDLAVERTSHWVFRDAKVPSPVSKFGNPDLVLVMGELGGPAGVRTGKLWADPVLQFYSGDREGGLARMEAVADSAWSLDWQREFSDTLQLCMVLAGDLARLSGKPERAMGWYHRVTWMEYEHFLKFFMTEVEGFSNPIHRNGYYRTLGVLRQAELLLERGRHSLALAELVALVDLDPAVTNNVRFDGVLFSHWKAASDSLTAWTEAVSAGRIRGEPTDAPDSLGYYANDWVEHLSGRVRARRPTRLVLEMDHLQRQAREEYLQAKRKSDDAESERNYARYQESIRRAAEDLEAAAPRASSRGQAFQFMPSRRDDVCFRCKGRGFQYVGSDVKQGWKYDPLTKSPVDTKTYTSGHLETCTWCGGSGKR